MQPSLSTSRLRAMPNPHEYSRLPVAKLNRMTKVIFILLALLSTETLADESDGDTLHQLAEELGIPAEITVSKRAIALSSWLNSIEKHIPEQDSSELCRRASVLGDRLGKAITEKKCMELMPLAKKQCSSAARDFYITHHVSGTLPSPKNIFDGVIRMFAACPAVTVLGLSYDIDKVFGVERSSPLEE